MIVLTVTVGSGRAYNVNRSEQMGTAVSQARNNGKQSQTGETVILESDGDEKGLYGDLVYGVSEEAETGSFDESELNADTRALTDAGLADSAAADEDALSYSESEDVSLDDDISYDDSAEDMSSDSDSDNSAYAEKSEAEKLLDGMSTEDKVAQLFIVTPEALTGAQGVTMAGESTKAAIDSMPAGGIMYMGDNLQSASQVKEMLYNTNSYSKERTGLPMLLCVDEEGGTVARVAGSGRFDVTNVGNMSSIGESGTVQDAKNAGNVIGTYLADLGFNVNFAPVADVLTNPENSIVKYRSFGSDKTTVADMAVAVAEGLKEEGIESTFKHFPGHGATAGDTHLGAAFTTKTKSELMEEELVPFQKAIDYGANFIMVSHISVPNITGHDTPASLSPEMIDGILRTDMGYTGVVITDAMEMGAISSKYTSDVAAVMAIQAGADMILTPEDFGLAYQGVLDAVNSGEISEERLNQSVLRIIEIKLEME